MYSAIYISSLQRGQPLHEITLHNRGCNFRVPAVRFFPPLFLICFLTLCFLLRLLALRSRILRHSIPIYLIPAHRISLSPAEVAAVAFNSVDVPAIAAFYDANVIPAAVAVPVKEDDVSEPWFVLSAAPLAFLLEPVYSVGYQCEFWNDASLYISALVGAP